MTRSRCVGGEIQKITNDDHIICAKAGNIVNSAKTQMIQNSKNKEVNYSHFLPSPNVVTKIEGPFDENWNKLKKVRQDIYSYYKVSVKDPEKISNLKWAVKNEGENIDKPRIIYVGGSLLEDNMVGIKYRPGIPKSPKFKLHAYFNNIGEAILDVEIGVYRFNINYLGCKNYFKVTSYKKREDWGAKDPIFAPNRSYELYTSVVEEDFSSKNDELSVPQLTSTYFGIAIHHSGNSGLNTMKKVQNEHLNEKERADVGYHFGIDLAGNVYEGRPIGVKGSHLDLYNTGVIGIVFLADLDHQLLDFDDDMTDVAMMACTNLINALVTQFRHINTMGAHREYKNNGERSCPGDYGLEYVVKLRNKLKLLSPKETGHGI